MKKTFFNEAGFGGCNLFSVSLTILLFALTSCANSNTPATVVDTFSTPVTADGAALQTDLIPQNEKPVWGPEMTDPMAVVIEKLKSFNAPPIETLSADEARKQPTPTDAVMAVMKEHHVPMPPNNVDTMGRDIPVQGGQVHLRIYTPKTGKSTYPVIVYYHGGGWVIADLNTYDASAKGLANLAEAVVVSVHYRQAPEHKFPTAHNDSYAAYEWTVKNAASIKGNAKKIAVVGESAGGNLAASVSMMARDKRFQLPLHQVLVYPIADYNFKTTSYKESDSTKPLNRGMMEWFFDKYLNNESDGKNPMISLVSADLNGLPATTIIGAEYDPLRTEGEQLSDNLKKAGINVTYKLYEGVTHEFFGMAAVLPEAKEAQGLAVTELKKAFGN